MTTRWLLAVLLALASSAAGQTVVTASVPFDFVVNHTAFPAGEYSVTISSYDRRLLIRNQADPQYTVFAMYVSAAPSHIRNEHKFVFAVNDGQHVLHQVYVAADKTTYDIVHGSDVAELPEPR